MGTNLLRAYMHGFFIDIRLYHKVMNSFRYTLICAKIPLYKNTWILACIASDVNFQSFIIYIHVIQHDLTICRGYRSDNVRTPSKHLRHTTVSSKGPGKRGHDVSWAAQTGKHLLQTQNVSEQRHKICVRNKCCARGQTWKHLCRQQCVGNNVSSFATALRYKSL